MGLIEELKRRKVLKVGAAYVVVAWLAVQGASIAFPAFDTPAWALRVFLFIALLGFPVTLMMAWAFDLGPDGVKTDIAAPGTKRILVVALALVALTVVWFLRGWHGSGEQGAPAAGSQVPAATPVATPVTPAAHKSVAVLAFADLSPQHDQEYFSDGMAEEVLNALAKVKDLKVAGRTASFYFKGKNEPLAKIGETLGVANILEGSVRKQGEKVRVTAQLIQASDGFHLWSETYDGDLSDVFALQERIARAITDQLKVVLEGGQNQRLVQAGTTNAEAYALYLQASATFNRRDGAHFLDAKAQLEQALKLDPQFARAHARLASLYVVLPVYTPFSSRESHDLVVREAESARLLDPSLAEPLTAVAYSFGQVPGHALEQREALERALALEPDDVQTNFWCGLSLVKTGYTKRGIERIDHALALDPLLPNALRWRAVQHIYSGDTARAEQLLLRAQEMGLRTAGRELGDLAAMRGDTETAVRLWTGGSDFLFQGALGREPGLIARGLYGDAAARAAALARIDEYLATRPETVPGLLAPTLARLGRTDQVLELMGSWHVSDTSDGLAWLWSPKGRALRALPGFPKFLRDFGLIDLWDRYGPADVCRRVAPGEYRCDEA